MTQPIAPRKALILDIETVFPERATVADFTANCDWIKWAQDNDMSVALSYRDDKFFCAAARRSGFKEAADCFRQVEAIVTASKTEPDHDDMARTYIDFTKADANGNLQRRDMAEKIGKCLNIAAIFPRGPNSLHDHFQHVKNTLGIPGEDSMCVMDDLRVLFVSDGHALCRDVREAPAALERFLQTPQPV